jgi:hypothetical protein
VSAHVQVLKCRSHVGLSTFEFICLTHCQYIDSMEFAICSCTCGRRRFLDSLLFASNGVGTIVLDRKVE